ncbi:hypothetical protein ACE6H2_007407 [Prunus campanulata]
MHPGNIPVWVAQSKSSRKRLFKSKPHVIFLDLGTTAELSKGDKSNFKAVALRDGRSAAECTLRLSKQHKFPDPKAFIEGTPEGDLVHPAKCMQQLVEKVRRHRVNVCTFMVTTLVLEGWLRKLDPGKWSRHLLSGVLQKVIWYILLSVCSSYWRKLGVKESMLMAMSVLTIMVITLVLEGWQRKLDPGYNVMQTLLLKADWAKSLSYTIEGLMAS